MYISRWTYWVIIHNFFGSHKSVNVLKKMIVFLLAVAIVGVIAEPPVDRQYLPPGQEDYMSARQPSNTYGAPSAFGRSGGAPSSQYGAPARYSSDSTAVSRSYSSFSKPGSSSGRFGSGSPSTRYGAPASGSSRFGSGNGNGISSQYGAPSAGSSRFNAPSPQYGAPAPSSRFGGSAPSSRYGAPAPSARYGAPEARFGGENDISTQYGAPSVGSARFGGSNDFSSQYNAPSAASSRFSGAGGPSTQYGAPSAVSSRFSGSGSPSTQYGAPSVASNRFSSPSTQYGAPAANSRSNQFSSQSSYNTPSARYGAPSPVYGAPAGYSAQEDPLAEPANYEFGYEVQDPESGSEFSQEETRQDEAAHGSYRVLLPDGRLQTVEYEANESGYNPVITYEDTNNGGPYPSSRGGQGPY